MNITFSINKNAYVRLHPSKNWPSKPASTTQRAVADTGAQTCTAGIDILSRIKGATSWLLKTKHRLRGVNNNLLDIQGALLVEIECPSGKTTEVLYVCDKVNGIYLSQTALKRMNVIHKNFPSAAVSSIEKDTSPPQTTANSKPNIAPCGCPLRSPCPPPPEKIPFPATLDYRQSLEDWIKQKYASSAFNVCPHQKLR